MNRRTLLRWLTASLGAFRLGLLRALAQPAQVQQLDTFSAREHKLLEDLALVVLPSSLGSGGSRKVANEFAVYVRDYRAGADTEHGYGVTRVVPKPPSPARRYAEQLRALPSLLTKESVRQAITQANIKELPRVPDCKNVIADLMAFYFRSSDANDLCYRASIERDKCRGLAGSENPPAPLRESA
jgi:hypothetical protein